MTYYLLDIYYIYIVQCSKVERKICLERGQQVSAASLDTGGLFLVYNSYGRGMPTHVHFR